VLKKSPHRKYGKGFFFDDVLEIGTKTKYEKPLKIKQRFHLYTPKLHFLFN